MRLIVSELRDDMPLTFSKEVLSCSEDEEEPDTCELALSLEYIIIELFTLPNFPAAVMWLLSLCYN